MKLLIWLTACLLFSQTLAEDTNEETTDDNIESRAATPYYTGSNGGYNAGYTGKNTSYYYSHMSSGAYEAPPGSYPKSAFGGPMYYLGRSYSPKSIYHQYLVSGYFHSYSSACSKHYGQPAKISVADLDAAFSYALNQLKNYQNAEKSHYNSGLYSKNVTTYGIERISYRHKPAYRKEKEAMFMEYASKYLAQYNCLSKYDSTLMLPNVKVDSYRKNPYGDSSCQYAYSKGNGGLKCDYNAKYRNIDGSCNNIYHPYWGKSNVCHLRLVPSAYDDGLSLPRLHGHTGKPLPDARVISNTCHAKYDDKTYYTHYKVAWGQFVNHDITLTPQTHTDYGTQLDCCGKNKHPQCLPIKIPKGDYLNKYNRYCMSFTRSVPCPVCTLGPRQQMNSGTSFLDNGAIYGNMPEDEKRLRTYKYGLLKSSKDYHSKEIPPTTTHPYREKCNPKQKGMLCFDAGDPRINQHPSLQLMHLVWLRRHNQHARALYKVNPKWNDEYLYQEARRLAIAELQYITYNEYLPIVFGPAMMKYYSLEVNHPGYTYYEPHTDPTTWNDYSAAACRFGHSQIRGLYHLIGTGYNKNYTDTSVWLRDVFFDPYIIHSGQCDALSNGLIKDRSSSVDPWVSDDVRNYLFKTRTQPWGYDLVSINIQRGRDHGLPGYTVYLEFCFGFKAYSWEDLHKFIPKEQVQILRKVYSDIHEIDFWSGGMSERKYTDADVGPTFACVLGIQYYHIKFGDRYFVTHGKQAGSFSQAQLANIKSVTSLANIICKTGDYMNSVQKYAFFPADAKNPMVSCKKYPEIDYNLWKSY